MMFNSFSKLSSMRAPKINHFYLQAYLQHQKLNRILSQGPTYLPIATLLQ